MRKKKVIVYQRKPEDFEGVAFTTDCDVTYANPRFFNKPKTTVDYFLSKEQKVIDAHEKAGIPMYPTGEKVKKPSEEPVEREVEKEPDVKVEEDVLEKDDNAPTYETQDSSETLSSDPLPEDWRELPFPKMRSLAKNYTNEPLKNGEQVKELLEFVEEQQAK